MFSFIEEHPPRLTMAEVVDLEKPGKRLAMEIGSGYFDGMQTKIERVGDGFGVLLPKELLDACGFGTEATVTVRDKALIVTPVPRRPREGWAEALRAIPQTELDRDSEELEAFRETTEQWDATEWQWPEPDSNEKA